MTHDQFIALIGPILGGLGIGSLATTVITKWLEGRSERKRWLRDKKWECYVELVRSLGELHTLIGEMLALDQKASDYAREFANRQTRANEAFVQARQFGSLARLAVAASVRKVLTRFGNEWNRAGVNARQKEIVAKWGWLVITDIGRNDLFGEPREMSDDFVGDLDVPTP
ncbi:MAG TPA: hypothetical protein VKG23_07810 [Thermoanaerobaculia bacterium]|nr:hypothetical protein [Thermoanaerobaculia bacterium]